MLFVEFVLSVYIEDAAKYSYFNIANMEFHN